MIPEDTNSSIDIYIYDRQLDILERLNPTYNSTQVNNQTEDQFITPDGRYIVFESIASNIISNDTNGQWDIFLYDRQTDTSQRVSIASDGTQGNGGSRHPSISEDGRYVTFSSNASNLVDNDTNSYTDVFIHDNQTGETTRISVASDGTQGNEKSGITHISTPSGPIISEDGKYIAFDSSASNLVSQDINGKNDIFLTINPQYPVNTPPILNPIGNKTIGEGQLLEFTVTATDPDGDDLTFSAANLPSGANFDPQTATFSWTPGYDQEGNYEDVEFTVTDDGTPIELDTELITITVGNINRAPEFDPIGPQEVLEDENLTFTVSATDPDGDNFTLSAQGLPTGATFDDQTGIFSWTPTLSQEGIYVVTFNATDNGTPVEVGSIDVDITVGDNPTPVEQAENLVEEVINYEFPTNVENSYLANLKKVAKFIEDGKIQPAINQLNAFIDKVEEDYLAGIITQEERDNLVGLAEALLADLQ